MSNNNTFGTEFIAETEVAIHGGLGTNVYVERHGRTFLWTSADGWTMVD